jgi:hypothetical protein
VDGQSEQLLVKLMPVRVVETEEANASAMVMHCPNIANVV